MSFTSIYCIDGSGNQIVRNADKKRPIYKVDVTGQTISRSALTSDQSASQFFEQAVAELQKSDAILIAADVPIGLPVEPKDVYEVMKVDEFLKWLELTDARLTQQKLTWREGLIANSPADRTSHKPVVRFKKGDKVGDFAGKRLCDTISRGESIFCVDHGAKQVGRAALQFWFEVLIPIRKKFPNDVAVWPFEDTKGKKVVIAECYPAACQRMVFGKLIKKRDAVDVSNALISLATNKNRLLGVELETWIHAGSSEDEFDMFTTAFAFRDILMKKDDLLKYPDKARCKKLEGWMLGLDEVAVQIDSSSKNPSGQKKAPIGPGSPKVGKLNRNDQENLGTSGKQGPKGPMYRLRCHRKDVKGIECGHEHETNPQDVFHKKCPQCQ